MLASPLAPAQQVRQELTAVALATDRTSEKMAVIKINSPLIEAGG